MAELNKIVCVEKGGNTGFGDCVLSFKTVVGAIIFRGVKQWTPAELQDFQATLTTMAMDDNMRDRAYPIHGFVTPTDATEEKTIQTFGYGSKAVVREGDYDWTFQFVQGGICLLKALRNHNGTGVSALFYDVNGIFFGQKIGDNLASIPMDIFHADPWRISDGSNASIYRAQFVFRPRYINEDLGFVDVDWNPALIEGLQDVALVEGTGSAIPALKVNAYVGCNRENLYDTFDTELAAVGAWVATIGGSVVAIDSVAVDPTISGWTVTLDITDPNYNAAGPVVLSLVTPSALDALGVSGYESLKLTITA